MKMLVNFLLLSFSSTFLVGCESVVNFNDSKYDNQVCEEMTKVGDINSLFRELDDEVSKVQRILNNSDELSQVNREKLHIYSANILSIGKKVEKLTNVFWTDSRVPYSASWLITPKAFRNKVGPVIPSGFKIIDAEIENIYLSGELRNDLKDNFMLIVKSGSDKQGSVRVDFNNQTSYLFSCQLKKTFLVSVKVYVKVFSAIKEYYINLVIGR